MKKYLVSMLLVVLSCMTVKAQSTVVNNPDNRAYFGIRFGGELTLPGKISVDNCKISAFNNGGGIELGGIYNIPIVANFYIEPGVKFYYNTYSAKKWVVEAIMDDVIFNSASYKKFGGRIPLMAGYHFDFTKDFKVSLFTGPELEIGFSAKEYLKGYNIETSGDLYDDDEGMKRVNLLWSIGAGLTYQHFYFGVNGGIGMLNLYESPDVKFHENHVTFSIGYNF